MGGAPYGGGVIDVPFGAFSTNWPDWDDVDVPAAVVTNAFV